MKALIAILVVLVLVVAGLVVADRVAESYASSVIAQKLTSDLRLSQKPQVQIQGFPFLNQWATGDYQEIDVRIPSATAQTITVTDIDAVVKGFHANPFLTSGANLGTATASSVELTGLVAYSQVPLPSGFTAAASGSQLEVSGSISFLGVSIPVTATEQISLSGSTVAFKPTDVRAQGGGINVDVSGAVAKKLSMSFSLQGLPLGLQVTAITVGPQGLQVTAQGQNVSLAAA
ncbi:MAG: LmeA family phospholipid-binding protein [Candidatus Dormibacteraceae bacterium]